MHRPLNRLLPGIHSASRALGLCLLATTVAAQTVPERLRPAEAPEVSTPPRSPAPPAPPASAPPAAPTVPPPAAPVPPAPAPIPAQPRRAASTPKTTQKRAVPQPAQTPQRVLQAERDAREKAEEVRRLNRRLVDLERGLRDESASRRALEAQRRLAAGPPPLVPQPVVPPVPVPGAMPAAPTPAPAPAAAPLSVAAAVPATPTFPLANAYAEYVSKARHYDVSGTMQIDGDAFTLTGTLDISAPVVSRFNGAPAMAKTFVLRNRLQGADGQSGTVSANESHYYDVNYRDVGTVVPTYQTVTVMAVLPAAVKVGDSGSWTSDTMYADASRTVPAGQGRTTYAVRADSGNSVLLTLEDNDTVTVSGTRVTSRVTETYRLTAGGDLRLLSASARVHDGRAIAAELSYR